MVGQYLFPSECLDCQAVAEMLVGGAGFWAKYPCTKHGWPKKIEASAAKSNFELFDEVLASQLAQTQRVLGSKGQEYSKGKDRFSNFKDAARIEGVTPEKALLGMMVKHEVSVRDIVENIETKLPSEAMLDEKIGDWINYLVLLKGLITERIRNA